MGFNSGFKWLMSSSASLYLCSPGYELFEISIGNSELHFLIYTFVIRSDELRFLLQDLSDGSTSSYESRWQKAVVLIGKINPDIDKKFLYSAKLPGVLCDPPNLLFNRYPVSLPGVKRPGHEAKHTYASRA